MSDSEPSAGTGPALLYGLTARTRQQNGNYSREGSPAALSTMQDAGGQDKSVMDKRNIKLLPPTSVQSIEGARCGYTQVEPVAMPRGASRSTGATLTDRIDFCRDTPAYKPGTILWRYIAFRIVRSPNRGDPNHLSVQIMLPCIGGGDESLEM
jgi:hypothetical protein